MSVIKEETKKARSKFNIELEEYFKAGFSCLLIRTSEESRVCDYILEISVHANAISWNSTEGIKIIRNPKKDLKELTGEDTVNIQDALKRCYENEKKLKDNKNPDGISNLFIFKDVGLYPLSEDPPLNRLIKDFILTAKENGSCVIFTGEVFNVPINLERLITVHDFPLPDEEDFELMMKDFEERYGKNDELTKEENDERIDLSIETEEREKVKKAAKGLDIFETENAFAKSIVSARKFDPDIINKEKIKNIKRAGILEIIEPEKEGLNAIGGLDPLKEWITKRTKCFTKEAELYGVPLPKGILIVGPPGSGKSLTSKAVGTAFGIPTVRLDIGRVFGKLVGQSEENTRQVLKQIDGLAPCVLWIDEIEKGLSGAGGSGQTEGGTTQRVFGTILTWMQDRKSPVFMVATANNVTSIPPEFLRKGRFDELWATSLPTEEERKKIFEIHLVKKRRENQKKIRKLEEFNISLLVKKSMNFTGAEIEECIISAINESFYEGKDYTTEDIIKSMESTKIIADTMKENIKAINDWCKDRARRASRTNTISTSSSMSKTIGGRKIRTN